ncbi:MAG: hypothetical protein Q9157_002211 [Trypethelium eluteriae]
MLKDRGYELLEEEVEQPFDEFRQRFSDAQGGPNRGAMAFSAKPSSEMIEKYHETATKTKPANDNIGTVWVEFNGEPNVGIKQLRAFVHHIAQHNFYTGIFVSKSSVTGAALKVIPTILPQIVEVFDESDLLVNITKHELVPKHVLLSPEEKRALLQRYRLKETQLPRIQKDDPVARYLGLRRGQVVKIIRRSETAGRYASYRWCI